MSKNLSKASTPWSNPPDSKSPPWHCDNIWKRLASAACAPSGSLQTLTIKDNISSGFCIEEFTGSDSSSAASDSGTISHQSSSIVSVPAMDWSCDASRAPWASEHCCVSKIDLCQGWSLELLSKSLLVSGSCHIPSSLWDQCSFSWNSLEILAI